MSDLLDNLAALNWDDEPDDSEEETPQSSGVGFENQSGLPKAYLKLTIGELVRRHGGSSGLKEYTSILKTLLQADQIEQAMKERRNELVEKDFIVSNVKKYIDLLMSNAFDTVESQKKIITATYKANLEDLNIAEEKVEIMRKESLTKISRAAVRSINQNMKGLNKKYDDPDS